MSDFLTRDQQELAEAYEEYDKAHLLGLRRNLYILYLLVLAVVLYFGVFFYIATSVLVTVYDLISNNKEIQDGLQK